MNDLNSAQDSDEPIIIDIPYRYVHPVYDGSLKINVNLDD